MYYGLINSMNRSAGYTSRTTDFATATGITDATILNAYNNFDNYIINNSLDSLLYSFHGLHFGNSSKNSINFINTSTFTYTFFGGLTHQSNGILTNGTNGYLNSNFNPNTILSSANDGSYGYYHSDDLTSLNGKATLGAYTSSYFGEYYKSTGEIIPSINDGNPSSSAISIPKTAGFHQLSRNPSSLTQLIYKKNATDYTKTISSVSKPNTNVFIGAYSNSGSASDFISANFSFVYFGKSLTVSQQGLMYTAISNLKTDLGI